MYKIHWRETARVYYTDLKDRFHRETYIHIQKTLQEVFSFFSLLSFLLHESIFL